MKIQSTTALKQQMRAVARGEQSPPADAALPSIESAAALLCVLTRIRLARNADSQPPPRANRARRHAAR